MKLVLCTLATLMSCWTAQAQNEVELLPNGIVVPRMAIAPASATSTEGQLYYNTKSNKFQYFNGSSWLNLVPSQNNSVDHRIEDSKDASTFVETIDDSQNGIADVINISIDGTSGMTIDKLPSKDLRINLSSKNDNVVFGENAGELLRSLANDNILIGKNAGAKNIEGDDNVYIGDGAGSNDTNGDRNVFIGGNAGTNYDNTNGSAVGNNVFLGYNSGFNSGGTNNTYLGSTSGIQNTGIQNVFIGNGAGANETNRSHTLIIDNNSVDPPLIYGEFDNEIVRIAGDLEILPKGGPGANGVPHNNSHLKMLDSNGNMDEIIRRGGTNNDVVMGDVDNNGGNLHLRSSGTTSFSVLANGAAKFWPMSDPPGTCNTSRRGQVYYDSDDDKLKCCGNGLTGFKWRNMF